MKGMSSIHVVLGFILIITASPCFSAEPNAPKEDSKYLQAVREFADNVLKYGRDTYGPKHTPLFVDGLNIHTHEPVKWISPVGGDPLTATETEEWIISNFASQQTLLRTLDGLSKITGDPKYHDAAVQAVKYAFENLRAPNGLFYWGNMAAYDVLTESVRDVEGHHTIKWQYRMALSCFHVVSTGFPPRKRLINFLNQRFIFKHLSDRDYMCLSGLFTLFKAKEVYYNDKPNTLSEK